MSEIISIVRGKELKPNEISIINEARKKEFNSTSIINPQPDNEDWEKIYFLLKDEFGNLLAFARFHDVKIEFMKETYEILGSATLVSLIKERGYGSKLKRAMIECARAQNKTSIGFCNPKLSEFYRKLECGIIQDGSQRFLYKSQNNDLLPFTRGGDLLYIEGNDKLISKILSNPNEKIISNRDSW